MTRVQPMPETGDVPIPAPRYPVLPPCPVDPYLLMAKGVIEGPGRRVRPITRHRLFWRRLYRSLVGFLLAPSPF